MSRKRRSLISAPADSVSTVSGSQVAAGVPDDAAASLDEATTEGGPAPEVEATTGRSPEVAPPSEPAGDAPPTIEAVLEAVAVVPPEQPVTPTRGKVTPPSLSKRFATPAGALSDTFATPAGVPSWFVGTGTPPPERGDEEVAAAVVRPPAGPPWVPIAVGAGVVVALLFGLFLAFS